MANLFPGGFALGGVIETTAAAMVPLAVIDGLLALSLPPKVSADMIAAVVFVLALWFFGYADV